MTAYDRSKPAPKPNTVTIRESSGATAWRPWKPLCDGHVVELPDPTTWNGYPECPCQYDHPDRPACANCVALVAAVEADRPCPDGGLHYSGALCVHYDGQPDHQFPAVTS